MIVLDTNIVSEVAKQRPDANVIDWLRGTRRADLILCAPVLAELVFGAEKFRLRTADSRYFESIERLRSEIFSAIMVDFDASAAREFGIQRALRESRGLPILEFDLMIAAICLVHDATLATRNVRDFDGLDLKLVNPFEASA